MVGSRFDGCQPPAEGAPGGRRASSTEPLSAFLRSINEGSSSWRFMEQRRRSTFLTNSVGTHRFRWVDRDTAYRWINLPVYFAVRSANLAILGLQSTRRTTW